MLIKMKYKEETIEEVSKHLANGLNSVEISKELNLHEVTIRNIKLMLKKRFYEK